MKRDLDEELVWSLHTETPSLDQIRRLTAIGANINATDDAGDSILVHAVRDSRVPTNVVAFLVEQGAYVNAVNKRGTCVLGMAVWNRRLQRETVELLVALGADVNAVDKDGSSVLMNAVSNSRLPKEMIECLIELGANTNTVDHRGESVLGHAITCWRKDIIETLIDHGANVHFGSEEALYHAVIEDMIGEGEPELVACLLRNGANPNIINEESTVLDFAEEFHFDSQTMSQDHDECNARHLRNACAVVELLKDAGAKPYSFWENVQNLSGS
jgi:ankyrin repeat protein